jgi:citrate lyase subunit beta / citryl-CoA lyase
VAANGIDVTRPPALIDLPSPALLFCPADRPERYAKAAAAADVVVLDLEDAVAASARPSARRSLQETLLDPAQVIVRVNAAGTSDHEDDLAALAATPYRNVMLAKAESPDQVRALERWQVVALCETPRGVRDAEAIAAVANTVALMWGAEDLLASLGGRTSRYPDGRFRDVARHARASVLLAAKAHGRQAIDAVVTDIANTDLLVTEADDAAQSGFDLKACIHPSQAAFVRRAYQPSSDQVAWAERVVAAAAAGGVTQVDRAMIDGPIIKQAHRVLAWRDRG